MLYTHRRTLFFVMAGLAVLVLAVVIVAAYRWANKDSQTRSTDAAAESTPFTQPSVETVPAMPPKDPQKVSAEAVARLFAERIGSYSTQSNYSNIDDVRSLMTPRVQAWADGLRIQDQPDAYHGTTTRVLTLEIVEYEPGSSAVIKIGTQRQEETDGSEARVYYQNAQVHLVFQESAWMVDGIYWDDEQ